MADDAIERHLKDMEAAFRAACAAAYEQGGRDMRAKILAAAGAGLDQDVPPSLLGSAGIDKTPTKRAPRGLVGEVVELVLETHPGLTLSQIEAKALDADARVAPKSISNELHRKKGEKYRQEGRHWYLIVEEPNEPTAQKPSRPFAWLDKGDEDAPA